jgi:hypothetical protein
VPPPFRLLVPGLLLALVLAACRPAPDRSVSWDDIPAARLAPADSEGFLLVPQASTLRESLAPSWRSLTADPSVRDAWLITPWGRILEALLPEPDVAAQILAEFTAGDTFVILGPGTATQLATVQQVKRLFEAARLRNLFTPPLPPGVPEAESEPPDLLAEDLEDAAFTEVMVPLPPAMEAALGNFVQSAKLPPVMVGGVIPADSTLPARFAAWAETLPPHVTRDTFDFEGAPFVRLNLLVANLVPREAAVRARDFLAANIGDPYNATLLVRGLLAKSTTLSFGRARGFFIVCIGFAEGVPVLAGTPESSLPATPAMQMLEDQIGPGLAAVFHADALISGLAASPPPVGEYLDAALESALEFAPPARIRPLRTAAADLRTRAVDLFLPRVSSASGILRKDGNRWSAEIFGGSLAPRLAAENAPPLLGEAPSLALVWNEHWQEGYAQRLLAFAGNLAAFSNDWMDALGPDFLDAGQSPLAGSLLRALQGPAARLATVEPELWSRAFGGEVALALDFSGAAPQPPLFPEAAGRTTLPRIALAAETGDRPALQEIWNQLTSASEGNPLASWPPPTSRTLPNGAALHEYPLPLGGPDLGAVVAADDSRWIFSTSPGFAEIVGGVPADGKTRAIQTVDFDTRPFSACAASWADALEADPSLAGWLPWFMPSTPSTLRTAAGLLQNPHRFHYEARWEDGAVRRSISLEPAP